jgi:uncharacterized damage-inducible protein DinB
MHPAYVKKYFLTALNATPEVLEAFLKPLPADDPRWDKRPDPDRFTLREIVAHLADWDPIFTERMEKTVNEELPYIPDRDEGQVALDHDYAHQDPHAALARFRTSRAATVLFLSGLADSDWSRSAVKEIHGPVTLERQAVLILAHDGYHMEQVVQWLEQMQ